MRAGLVQAVLVQAVLVQAVLVQVVLVQVVPAALAEPRTLAAELELGERLAV